MTAAFKASPLSFAETKANLAAAQAAAAIAQAIAAYRAAGYGSLVTQPLQEALAHVNHSIREVKS